MKMQQHMMKNGPSMMMRPGPPNQGMPNQGMPNP